MVKHAIVDEYARMWPREIFDRVEGNKLLAKSLDMLSRPGIYVLYKDEEPHYIGKTYRLRRRLCQHATQPGDRYYYFWTHFSAFVIEDAAHRDELEGILIAAMPTANSASPKLLKRTFPKAIKDLLRDIRRGKVSKKA